MLAIALCLYSAFKLAETRDSTERVLANPGFVFGYFVLGLAAPLALMLWLGFGMGEGAATAQQVPWSAVGVVLGLAGGVILRWAVLTAGALPTWHIAGCEFRRVSRPKESKLSMGLLPPSGSNENPELAGRQRGWSGSSALCSAASHAHKSDTRPARWRG